jgi:type II secretory pathway pseudopilin PulG
MDQTMKKRNALTLPELIIVVVILVFLVLVLLSRMPRAREEARAVACLNNLRQIGQAINLYVQNSDGVLPTLQNWQGERAEPGTSLFHQIRLTLKLNDFVNISDQTQSSKENSFDPLPERVAGLRCPSDRTLSPIGATNYRFNTGSEARGSSGPFAIGRSITMQQIEDVDGLAFTAAVSERLIGTGENMARSENYFEMKDCGSAIAFSIVGKTSKGIPFGDSGHQWSVGDFRQTLYHHGMTPNWIYSSVAKNGNCGQMGASSGHNRFVHVLLLDGSAKSWNQTVDEFVWKRLGTIDNGSSE